MVDARTRVARAFAERHLEVCNLKDLGVDLEDLMKAHGDEFLEEADIVLQAAGFAEVVKALTQLCFMARTTGGTAGPDPFLIAACEGAEALIAKTGELHG